MIAAFYYNEWDPKAAAWLRKLIELGYIANGHVDERSITEISPNDLKGYAQHHFFAGIGGWSYALRLSRWPDDIPVWTASLPCQPFSTAGKGLGNDDERHLLPHFLDLVTKCRPDVLFGEQVEGAIKHGWLDDLQTTMEAEDYAIGHCVLGAHSVSAAHIRQRLYWVADYCGERLEKQSSERGISSGKNGYEARQNSAGIGRLGIPNSPGSQQRIETTETARYRGSVESAGGVNGMGNAESERETRQSGQGARKQEPSGGSNISWLYCRDGKYRPIESGLKPLVDGVPRGMVHSGDPFNTQEARTVRLKGYGNAIVPQVAAEFIKAFMSCKR